MVEYSEVVPKKLFDTLRNVYMVVGEVVDSSPRLKAGLPRYRASEGMFYNETITFVLTPRQTGATMTQVYCRSPERRMS